MSTETYPLQVLLITIAGWVNRHQQDVIAYLVEESRRRRTLDMAAAAVLPEDRAPPGDRWTSLPPRKECAELWHARLLGLLRNAKLTLLLSRPPLRVVG